MLLKRFRKESHTGSQNQRRASGFLWFKGLSKTCALATILTCLGRWTPCVWHVHTLEPSKLSSISEDWWYGYGPCEGILQLSSDEQCVHLGHSNKQCMFVLVVSCRMWRCWYSQASKSVRCRTDMKPSTNSRHLWIRHVACGVWTTSKNYRQRNGEYHGHQPSLKSGGC